MAINNATFTTGEKITSIKLNHIARDADNAVDNIHPQYHNIIHKSNNTENPFRLHTIVSEGEGAYYFEIAADTSNGNSIQITQSSSPKLIKRYNAIKLAQNALLKYTLSATKSGATSGATAKIRVAIYSGDTSIHDATTEILATETDISITKDLSTIADGTLLTIITQLYFEYPVSAGTIVLNAYNENLYFEDA